MICFYQKKSPMIWCINEGGEEQKAWLFLLICCYHYLTWVLRNLNYSITEPASVTTVVQFSLSWCQHGRNHQSCKGEGYNFSVVWFHENEKKQKGKQRDPGYEKTQGKRQKEERNPTAPHPTFFFFTLVTVLWLFNLVLRWHMRYEAALSIHEQIPHPSPLKLLSAPLPEREIPAHFLTHARILQAIISHT